MEIGNEKCHDARVVKGMDLKSIAETRAGSNPVHDVFFSFFALFNYVGSQCVHDYGDAPASHGLQGLDQLRIIDPDLGGTCTQQVPVRTGSILRFKIS